MNDKIPEKSVSFEEALQELENIVSRMDNEDQALENSLADFERGIELVNQCQRRLKHAEQHIKELILKVNVGDGQLSQEPDSKE